MLTPFAALLVVGLVLLGVAAYLAADRAVKVLALGLAAVVLGFLLR